MQTIIATALFLGVIMAIMALGVIVRGRPLRGSCGGATNSCGCSPKKQARCASQSGTKANTKASTKEPTKADFMAGTKAATEHHAEGPGDMNRLSRHGEGEGSSGAMAHTRRDIGPKLPVIQPQDDRA